MHQRYAAIAVGILLVILSSCSSLREKPPPLPPTPRSAEAEALYCMALMHLTQGNVDLALSELRSASAMMPENVVVTRKHASALLFKASVSSDVQAKAAAVDEAWKVLNALRSSKGEKPDDLYAMCMGAGDLMRELRMWDQAESCYEWAQEADETKEEPFIKRASLHMARREWKPAIQLLRDALDLASDLQEATYDLAFCLWQMDRGKEAMRHVQTLLKRDDPEIKTIFLCGMIMESQGEDEEAKKAYERIIEKEPSHEQALRRLAALAHAKEDWEDALRWHMRILDVAATDAEARFGLAIAYERLGYFTSAAEEFRKLISEKPEAAEALNYLGYMYAERGIELEEAENLIQSALRLDPQNGAYVDSLGWVLFQKGEIVEAIEALERAQRILVSVGEDDPVVREHLGDAYARQGDLRRAIQEWKAAKKLDPKNERVGLKIRRQGLHSNPEE